MSDETNEARYTKATWNVAMSTYDRIKEIATERGVTITAVFNELLVAALDTAPPWVTQARTIDYAAETILSALPAQHQQLIREVAQERHRPIAAFIMSYVLLALEQGRAAQLLSEYADPLSLTLAGLKEREKGTMKSCEYCHMPFEVTKDGQRYCPPPAEGESCGAKAYRDEYEKKRSRKLTAPVLHAEQGQPTIGVGVTELA